MNSTPKTVEEYLATIPYEARAALQRLRQTIQAAAPEAAEGIGYGIPIFRQEGHLVGYSAHKNHYSLHAMSTALFEAHADELGRYEKTKGSIHFRYDEPLPAALVEKLVKARIHENEARAEAKAATRPARRPAGSRAAAAQPESDLPAGLAAPARRALAGAGLVRLEQLSLVSEQEVRRLHGMGPKALEQLRSALSARGLSFAKESREG